MDVYLSPIRRHSVTSVHMRPARPISGYHYVGRRVTDITLLD